MNILLDVGEKIEIVETNFRKVDEPDKLRNKCEDVKKLEQTIDAIQNFEDGQSDIKSTVKLIGRLNMGLSREYEWEDDPLSIRSKHGYVQRDKKGRIINDRHGIHFDKLSQLSIVLRHDEGSISDEHLQQLGNGLVVLKQELFRVLRMENSFINQTNHLAEIEMANENVLNSADIFIKICKEYYVPLIAQRFHSELALLDNIDYEQQTDRYVVAEILIRIGDLAKELIEFFPQLNKDKIDVLGDLYRIRSKIIHIHKRTKEDTSGTFYDTYIVELRRQLGEYIPRTAGIGTPWANLWEYTDRESLKKHTKSLWDYFDKSLTTGPAQQDNDNRKTVSLLDALVSKASDTIRGVEEHSARNRPIDQQLRDLNKRYQNLLQNNREGRYPPYPRELSVHHKDAIILYSKFHPPRWNWEIPTSANQLNFEHLIDEIRIEMDFLQPVEFDSTTDVEKRKYATLYIVRVISQYLRDIGEIDISHTKHMTHLREPIDIAAYEMPLIFDAKLLSTLTVDTLSERDSINYVYTYPEFQSSSIYAITMCNVAVSFFKMGLHKEAIRYLESCSTYLSESDREITLAQQPIEDNVLTLWRDRYWFVTVRTLANVYRAADRNVKAMATFESMADRISCEIADLNGMGIQIEIVNVFTDFAFFLTDQHSFERAIDIFEMITKYTNDIAVRMKYFEALYNNGYYENADNLLNGIMSSVDGDIAKSKVLAAVVSICVCHGEYLRGISDAERYITKLDNIARDTFGIIEQQSVLTKLKISFAKLRYVSGPSDPQLGIDRTNAERLMANITFESVRSPIKSLIYLSLAVAYSRNILLEFDEGYFESAKSCLEQVKPTVNKKAKPLVNVTATVNIRQKLAIIAIHLSMARNGDTQRNLGEPKIYIEHLKNVQSILEQFQIIPDLTFQNLMNQYKRQAGPWNDDQGDVDSENYDNASLSLERAVRWLKSVSKYQMRPQIMIDILKEWYLCTYHIGNKRRDMTLFVKADDIYKDMLLLHGADSGIVQCIDTIYSFIKFLRQYLDSECVIKTNDNLEMIAFCNYTLGIEFLSENGDLVRGDFETTENVRDAYNCYCAKFPRNK